MDRVKAARSLGVRVLKDIPQIGTFLITDPAEEIYLTNGKDDDLRKWQQTAHDVARAIEDRGLGIAKVKALGLAMRGVDPEKAWFSALTSAKDIHERGAVKRAFYKWADGNAIASHVAYGIDVFALPTWETAMQRPRCLTQTIGSGSQHPTTLDL